MLAFFPKSMENRISLSSHLLFRLLGQQLFQQPFSQLFFIIIYFHVPVRPHQAKTMEFAINSASVEVDFVLRSSCKINLLEF